MTYNGLYGMFGTSRTRFDSDIRYFIRRSLAGAGDRLISDLRFGSIPTLRTYGRASQLVVAAISKIVRGERPVPVQLRLLPLGVTL